MKRWWFRRRPAAVPAAPIAASNPLTVVPNPPAEPQHLVVWIKTLLPTSPDGSVHEATVKGLLDSTPTVRLSGLDHDVRWNESWRTDPWESLAVDEAEQLIAQATDVLTVAAGLSMHRNGRVREVAVVALDRARDPRAVRWLVLRCGDWVPQVRDAATRGVETWLAPAHAAVLVDVLPILDGERFGRGRPSDDLPDRIEAVLRDPASQSVVDAGAVSPRRSIRRACVKLLAESRADIALLERVISTNDVVAIAMIAKALPTSGSVNRRVGEILFNSPMARFRSEGLWRLIKADELGSEDLARSSLSDAAPSVRDVAQRWMIRHGHDPSEFYRSMIDVQPLTALLGLGDRADRNSAAIVRRFADDSVPAIRTAALRQLAAVGDIVDGPLFADRFLNGTAKERRHAAVGMRRIGASRFIDDLWDAARERDDPLVLQRVVLQMLPMAGRWKRLDIGLQAIASGDPMVRDLGFEALRRAQVEWNRRSFDRPADRSLLQQRLADARPVFAEVRHRRAYPMMLESLESLLR